MDIFISNPECAKYESDADNQLDLVGLCNQRSDYDRCNEVVYVYDMGYEHICILIEDGDNQKIKDLRQLLIEVLYNYNIKWKASELTMYLGTSSTVMFVFRSQYSTYCKGKLSIAVI
jgi:hypothetical protein